MAEKETQHRIAEDLAAGDVAMARQRLRGLVGSYPERQDLRLQLADLYRREGHAGQAGRWSFLAEDADPEELAAFARDYPDPVLRMRVVGWRAAESDATPVVAERLAQLRAEAERAEGHALAWEHSGDPDFEQSRWEKALEVVGISAFMLVLALMAIGGVSFVIQGVKTVAAWFD
ncbi:DUF6584 family protein [Branchiibius sp. NY16-3462-2]|uniref:DUF6584 family protein n=1 Tax=Branchiibius sp. NY16-3462-2 TaxID=1807500 RepID=UPI000792636C|nr:DUF6584 family protein [Branchiibius sp. NY16-3462-2]KYH44069.1 hypothetical protein AZH51_04825 [Branchiibius sp. NY16-3462-2]